MLTRQRVRRMLFIDKTINNRKKKYERAMPNTNCLVDTRYKMIEISSFPRSANPIPGKF